PEAQLDRFLYKIDVPPPTEDELVEIARRTTGSQTPRVVPAADEAFILGMQALAREVPVEERVYRYAARIVGITNPADTRAPLVGRRRLRSGVRPRGRQALTKAAKVEALLDNLKAASIEDIRRVAYPALRHGFVLNYEAQAEG